MLGQRRRFSVVCVHCCVIDLEEVREFYCFPLLHADIATEQEDGGEGHPRDDRCFLVFVYFGVERGFPSVVVSFCHV